MCNQVYDEHLAPLNEQHLREVQAQYPGQADFAEKLYKVLTKNLTPQVNLFVSFVVLKEMYDQGKNGIFSAFGRVLYAPLSIVAKTGEHEWTRFRPRSVNELHTSFLSFMMAKPNRLALNGLFGQYGLVLSQGHCCGILFGAKDDVVSYEQSELFAKRNQMRSYAESMAMPVAETSFENIPAVTSDLGAAEREFYKLYENTFAKMAIQGRDAYRDDTQERIWDEIVVKVVDPALAKTEDRVIA